MKYLRDIFANKEIQKKILITLGLLAVYRLLVFVSVPMVDIDVLMSHIGQSSGTDGLSYFLMLLGGSLENFSIIAVGLAPYINASIIMQLLTSVIPALEDLQEQGEQGQKKIQQYMRYLTFPLAWIQSVGMVFFINYLLGGHVIATDAGTVFVASLSLAIGSMLLMWIGELITQYGISNGTSLLIFASIVAGITGKVFNSVSVATSLFGVVVFMLVLVVVLIILAIFILKSIKEIPIVYAKQGKVQQTSTIPIPMNPVGMVPIIFAIAFTSFPYLLSQFFLKFGTSNQQVLDAANRIQLNLNIYAQQPGILAIVIYFLLIVAFTFFYAMITFNPDKMADNIQKKGGFIPGVRPGDETAAYINGVLMHLCLWGGIGLAFLGVYSYVLNYIPFIQALTQQIGSLPVVVQGSGIIIIVGVVQDIIRKLDTELLTKKYDDM